MKRFFAFPDLLASSNLLCQGGSQEIAASGGAGKNVVLLEK